MFELGTLIDTPPFSLSHEEKDELYVEALTGLTALHYKKCAEYKRFLDERFQRVNRVKMFLMNSKTPMMGAPF